jgi:hypothetical protein
MYHTKHSDKNVLSVCENIYLIPNECSVNLNNCIPIFSFLQVIQHLFDWEAPKEEPTEQEMVFLLTTQFSVRVDLDRKVVEHVKRVDDHGVVSSASSNPTDSDRDLEPREMEVKKLKVQ